MDYVEDGSQREGNVDDENEPQAQIQPRKEVTTSTAEAFTSRGPKSASPYSDRRLHPQTLSQEDVGHRDEDRISSDGKTEPQVPRTAPLTPPEAMMLVNEQNTIGLSRDRVLDSQEPDQGIELEYDSIADSAETRVSNRLARSGRLSSKAEGAIHEYPAFHLPDAQDLVEGRGNAHRNPINAAHMSGINTSGGAVIDHSREGEVDLARTTSIEQDLDEGIEYDDEEMAGSAPKTRYSDPAIDILKILKEGEVKPNKSGAARKHTKSVALRGSRRSSSPLFVTSRASSTGSETSSQVAAGFNVVISPVDRDGDYQTYDFDPTVRSIVREVRVEGEVKYIVKSQDGSHTEVYIRYSHPHRLIQHSVVATYFTR
jgi:hypothetical protein